MKKQRRILIIDDEQDLCDLVKLILKEENFKIECAFSLEEGKKKWNYRDPNIVLLDQNLPDGSGLDLIKSDPTLLYKSKIIMITADTQPATKDMAIGLGVDFFIQKPFSLKLIRNLIHEILSAEDDLINAQ